MIFDTTQHLREHEQPQQSKPNLSEVSEQLIPPKLLKKHISRYITAYYPNKRLEQVNGRDIVLQEYNQFELFKLKSYNLLGMDREELQGLIDSYAGLAALYTEPLKIVCLHTPIQLQEQISYTREMIHRSSNELARIELGNRLRIFESLEAVRKQSEFFIFIYGYNHKVLAENIEMFERSKGRLEVQALSKQEKETLLFQMANLGLKPLEWKG